jgi:D-aspartate ligase
MSILTAVAAAAQELSSLNRHHAVKRAHAPAILLGGGANALSAARSLGRAGVPVFIINEPDALVRHSRYGRFIKTPAAAGAEQAWTDYLLGSASDCLRGAVLLACCDHGLTILARHHAALAHKFTIDNVNVEARVALLNKIDTYKIARGAGVDTPRFWIIRPGQALGPTEEELVFPLIVKPTHTHVLRQKLGKKLIIAHDFASLRQALEQMRALQMETMLVEFIPGRDDRLCSYYTYFDDDGAPLLHFTKRVIRRYPLVVGNGCYHITDWNPEVAAAGLTFLRAARIKGLASVEFKRDPRDGKLKLIECNARFTEANCLLAAAGLDLPLFVYNRLVGREQRSCGDYRQGLRLWYPLEDFYAFRRLHQDGHLTWRHWLGSIAHRQTLPYFRWYDPWPSVVREWRRMKAGLARRIGRQTSN